MSNRGIRRRALGTARIPKLENREGPGVCAGRGRGSMKYKRGRTSALILSPSCRGKMDSSVMVPHVAFE